jgi:crotonobetainyl-CoA:carnitine CoA-transferase CaiB-like acyl-CoA transferase
VWWAPAQSLEEVTTDAQLRAQHGFVPVRFPDGRVEETVAAPLSLAEGETAAPLGVPAVGEHGGEVLEEIGYNEAEIVALTRAGVVVLPG